MMSHINSVGFLIDSQPVRKKGGSSGGSGAAGVAQTSAVAALGVGVCENSSGFLCSECNSGYFNKCKDIEDKGVTYYEQCENFFCNECHPCHIVLNLDL